MTVPVFCRTYGVGQTTTWGMIKRGLLQVVRVPGIRRTLIFNPSAEVLFRPPSAAGLQPPPIEGRRGRPRKQIETQAGATA